MAGQPIQAITQPLRNLSILQGLTALQISEIARRADRIVFKPGESIITAHEPVDGAVVIVAGDAVRIAGPFGAASESIPAGAVLAEMGMLVETVATSTVVARSSVRALKITRDELVRHLADDPDIADQLISNLTARLRAVADEMRSVDSLLAEGVESPRLPLVANPALTTSDRTSPEPRH